MAEALLHKGARAVLSWGDRVNDNLASEAAGTFYEALAVGRTVTEALALTYQALLQSRESGQWHLLRLYVADILPGALVTPLRTKGREPIPRPDWECSDASFVNRGHEKEGEVVWWVILFLSL